MKYWYDGVPVPNQNSRRNSRALLDHARQILCKPVPVQKLRSVPVVVGSRGKRLQGQTSDPRNPLLFIIFEQSVREVPF